MKVKARKVGNSLTVTIPADVVKEMDITEGTDMNVFVREGTVVMEPVASRWDRLVARVRKDTSGRSLTEADIAHEVAQLRGRPTCARTNGQASPDDRAR